MRWLTAGESHGPALVAVLEGMPAGVEVTTDAIRRELARRRAGYGRGARMGFETDEVELVGGLRHGRTLGSPVALRIGNAEWDKWRDVMSPDPVHESALTVDAGRGDEREMGRNRPLTRPRPGHADLAGMTKYGFDEARPVLERASARETAARVALGAVAKAYLRQVAGARVVGHVVAVGGVWAEAPSGGVDPGLLETDPVRCADPLASSRMVERIDEARALGDTLGGVVEVVATGVPAGLGSYVQWDRRLDGRLAQALMSVPAVKAVELGDGWGGAAALGSEAHDEVRPGVTGGVRRVTNRAGGVEGGISNGNAVVVRAAVKPISTVPRGLASVDVTTGEVATAHHQRSDTTAVVPAAVIGEAVVALVLADALAEKVGGDSVSEARRNLEAYLASIPPVLRVGEER